MQEKIVITGMGTVSPLGLSTQETWDNLIHGISGVAPITLFDPEDFLVKIACEVKHFSAEVFMSGREARRRDRFEQFAAAAAREAMNQADLNLTDAERSRTGVVVSSAIGGITALEEAETTILNDGPRRVSPFVIPMLMPNGAAGLIAIDYNLRGPCLSIGSACASGADGIGIAWTLMHSGMIDIAIVGGSEATITKVGIAAFDRLGALSRRNEDYSHTPQPFDLHRDGLVMGEGAAVLVLEKESRARKRGAKILAELAGYGSSADAFHITAPSEDGAGGADAIRLALNSANANLDDVDYINAHGTATSLNDISETRAIKAVFREKAYQIPVSSTKSMTGHMMGATGALETIVCVQVVREGLLPPTINYQTPDPDCDLDYVPNTAREKDVRLAISNAFGFGGHNAVLVIKRYSYPGG